MLAMIPSVTGLLRTTPIFVFSNSIENKNSLRDLLLIL